MGEDHHTWALGACLFSTYVPLGPSFTVSTPSWQTHMRRAQQAKGPEQHVQYAWARSRTRGGWGWLGWGAGVDRTEHLGEGVRLPLPLQPRPTA